MTDSLPVHVNRESLHSLDVPAAFEADDSFDVRLINHGQPVHVHLHLDDALSDIASIEATNHYVDAESERPVRVTLREEGSVFGKLKVVTGYGAQTRYVDVDITEPEETEQEVQVDESLGKPQPESPPEAGGADGGLLDDVDSTVLLVGGLALVAAAVAMTLVPTTPVRVGAVLVVLSVLVGLYVARGD